MSRAKSGTAEPSDPKTLQFVLGLKFIARSRAEQRDLEAIEQLVRQAHLPDVVLDKTETGVSDFSLWFHTSNPKRAFKALSDLPPIAERLSTLQAAYADRAKLKFSILWPKAGAVPVPPGLG